MAILSEQAEMVSKSIKGFDKEDFDKFYAELHKVTIVGATVLIQYLDMISKGAWKDGKFIMPEGDKHE